MKAYKIISKVLEPILKRPYPTLVLRRRAVLFAHVNKPYMDCKQHEKIGKVMAANHYGSQVPQDL